MTALSIVTYEYQDILNLLLRFGADPNLYDRNADINGHSGHLIHWTVSYDFNTMVGILLKHGAALVIDNSYNATPLDLVVERGSERIVRILFDIFECPDLRPTGTFSGKNRSFGGL